MKATGLTFAVAALLAFAHPATAQIYGSLANFDAVNDTNQDAHGFEIQIEDPTYTRSKIYSVFGLDRNFGVPPTSVERYGAPVIADLPGIGVSVRYAATFANGLWNVRTPSGPYPFAGDSCWPLGNAAYAGGGLTCDHFGVATLGTPAKVTYSWLVDPNNSGTLTRVAAALPAINFAYQAPPANQPPAPQPVVAEIDAHKEANEVFGKAYWVKSFVKHVDHNVEVADLLKGNAVVPDDAEVEAEFDVFQAGGNNNAKGKRIANLQLNPADAALVLRYEFYRYQGPLKAFGEVNCGGGNGGGGGGGGLGPADCGGLGDYAGAQMAGFNAIQIAAVPEPATYAILLAGLGLIGAVVRRRAPQA